MILVESTGRVAAPIEAVWDVVRRVEHLPSWLAGVDRAEVVSGEGFGRRQLLHTADGGTYDAEVFAYREPTLVAWRERPIRRGARALGWTETHVELAPDGEGTAVRLIVVRWPAGPLTGALVRLGTHRIGTSLDSSITRLADVVGVGRDDADLARPPA
ncbi:MAG TPA: SRPBCC family protein [Micromonosporaceae bacterium]|nr:SRPBCC family protein [Micromonosporaceae bacterium]